MATNHLSTDEFLTRLTSLFEARRTANHGSVYLTQKRLTFPSSPSKAATDTLLPPSSPFPDMHPPHPLPILIRATDGKSGDKKASRVKISTIVQANELEGFFIRYAEVCKGGMSGLKKRDRSGRKNKGKKAKRRKEGAGEGEKKG